MIPGVIGYIPEYRGLAEPPPPGGYWASWAKWWKRGGRARGPTSPNRIGLGGRPPFLLSSLSFLLPFPLPFLVLVGVGKYSY